MEQLPDVQCWIKLIEQPTGQAIPSGTQVKGLVGGSVTVRYVVANDSNKATGNFTIVGALKRDGEKLPNPVPAKTIQLQPKEMWTHEHTVNKTEIGDYSATLLGDVSDSVKPEETTKNNSASAKFSIFFPVKV